jgi:hypothetical protein
MQTKKIIATQLVLTILFLLLSVPGKAETIADLFDGVYVQTNSNKFVDISSGRNKAPYLFNTYYTQTLPQGKFYAMPSDEEIPKYNELDKYAISVPSIKYIIIKNENVDETCALFINIDGYPRIKTDGYISMRKKKQDGATVLSPSQTFKKGDYIYLGRRYIIAIK